MKKNIFLLFISILFSLSVKAHWEWTNGPYGGEVQAMTTCSGRLFASTAGAGVFLSVDSGKTWGKSNNGLPSYYYTTHLAANSSTIFSGGSYGLYRSDDFGSSWHLVSSDFVGELLVVDSLVFYHTGSYLHISQNNGLNWTQTTFPQYPGFLNLLGNNLYSISSFSTDIFNLDLGTWSQDSNFNFPDPVYGAFLDQNIMIVSTDVTIAISIDSGITWTSTLHAQHDLIFSFGGRYYSTNGAELLVLDYQTLTWQAAGNFTMAHIISATSLDNKLFFGRRFSDGVYLSLDSALTWKPSNVGLSNEKYINAILAEGAIVIAGNCPTTSISFDEGTTWKDLNVFSDCGHQIIAVQDSMILSIAAGVLTYSLDTGSTWIPISTGLSRIYTIRKDGQNILAGTDQGLFLSNDFGQTWSSRNTGISNLIVEQIAISGQNIYVGTRVNIFSFSSVVYYSPDYGISWNLASSGLPLSSSLHELAMMGSIAFAAIKNSGIYKSEDNGLSWTLISTWPSNNFLSVAVSNSSLFACSQFQGIFFSQDTGRTWLSIQQDLIRGPSQLSVSATHLYAAVNEASIWKRSLSDILLSANELKESTSILLFPNPAQNKLCISLSNKATQKSKIEITNLAGSIVYSADAELSNSSCSKEIDISRFDNGFYILTVADKDGKGVVREKIVVQH
jgi:photosystem II stability/assembly factor-like uncharacterized protein